MRFLLGVFLLLGVLLLGVGAVFHPMLIGDATQQLHVIAATPYWRALHLAMLTGSACVMAGVWVRSLGTSNRSDKSDRLEDGSDTLETSAAPALVVVIVGLALNAFDIAVMASAGTHMAAAFAAGDASIAPIYEATHLIGVMTARFGNGVIALGAAMLGWTEWRTPRRRLPAILAWIAAAGGAVGVLAFDETSRAILGAVTLLCAWMVMTGIQALRPGGSSLH